MAVEIPVVIDIEGAFADAAKRVPAAVNNLESAIDKNPIKANITIGNIDSANEQLREMRKYYKELEDADWGRVGKKLDLSPYVNQAIMELRKLDQEISEIQELRKMEGGKGDFSFAEEYKRLNERVVAVTNSIRALQTTQSQLNLSSGDALFQKHLKSLTSSNEELAKMREYYSQLEDYSIKYSSSINAIRERISDLNSQWNSMTKAQRQGNEGKVVYEQFKKETDELKREARAMDELYSKEQRRLQLSMRGAQQRRYENAILNSSVTTMRVLQEQERILSDRLSRTQVGTTKYTKLQADLDKVRVKMQEIKGTTAGLNTELKRQSTIWSSIASYASMYFSFFGAVRFIKNVRETTAEFELQRVALAGIIQDTNKAEALFKEIKAAAIESPFQIKQLVTYTKQLSAYRVETDKLFDVTNRLADVSAGLGVDMNRLVLAYGQVKSASVLRGQELRQFTEAGIPLVDLLAKKFQELGREGTTTADVFELISKRAVPFSMIAEIFEDMSNKGGIFYKMQEKQAETLAGQWSNLKDALSIMYDEIGNTASVHGAMEKLISDAKFLFNNWRIIGGVLKGVTESFLAIKLASLFIPTLTKNTALAAKATTAKAKADELEAMNAGKANFARTIAIKQLRAYTVQMNKAATATTIIGRSWHQMAANLVGGGWISLATTAVMLLVSWLISARQESERLGKELAENIAKGNVQAEQSVRNFERLANMALSAADGSVEQREALKELQRTYGDILPVEDLQISKLKELKGNYKELTDVIREKIDLQIHEQNISQISDTFATSLGAQRKGLEKFLRNQEQYSVEEATRIMAAVEDAIKSGLLSIETDFQRAADIIEEIARKQVPGREPLPGFGQAFQQASGFFSVTSYYKKLLKSTISYNREISDEESRFSALNNQLGIYADKLKEIREELKNDPTGFSLSQIGTFEYSNARMKQGIERIKNELKNALAPLDISEAIGMEDFIDFNNIIKKITASNGNADLKAFVTELQKDYMKLAPQESATRLISQKAQEIAREVGVAMTDVKGYLKEDGQSMKDYAKALKEFLDAQKKKVEELKWLQQGWTMMSTYERPTDDDIAKEQKEVDFIERLLAGLTQFGKETKGSYHQDPFINKMQERIKFMQDFEKGYKNLTKYLSDGDALEKQFSIMQNRGESLGLDPSEQKRAAKDLSKWYEDARAMAFEQAKKYGASGTIEDFLRQEISDASTKGKALKDFQKLIQSLWDAQTDLDTSEFEREMKEALERVTENIKRSEAARDFYNNILGLTGDEDLATTMSVSVYGDIGEEFKDRMSKQLDAAFHSLNWDNLSDDVFGDLNFAFATKDFAKIFEYIDLFPEEWQKVLKQMATDNEKYTSGVASSYAKLLMKYDEIEQERINITNKARNDIASIEEGLALEIEGLQKRGATRKEIQAARDRASLAVDAVTRDSETQLFKLKEQYRLFFSSVGVISVNSAREVAAKQRKMLTDQFVRGQISLSRYKRELKEIDEQLKKYSGLDKFEKFASGKWGELLVENLSELSDGLISLAATAKTSGGIFSPNDDAKKFIDRVDRVLNFGDFTSIFTGKKKIDIRAEANAAGRKAYMDAIAQGQSVKIANSEADAAVRKVFDNYSQKMDEMAEAFAGFASAVMALLAALDKIGAGGRDIFDQIERSGQDVDLYVADFFAGISDFFGGILDFLKLDFGSGFSKFANLMGDARYYNREIKDQSVLLDKLQYQYDRLGAVIEDSFGAEYIYNYNKQLENLAAQAEAYRKQAEAERAKGKAADEDVAKGYDKSARDIEDRIAEMQSQLAEYFSGTDLTSAAEDFANAWIEAYKEFGSTTDAMSEKFDAMINNMINRSLAAKIMQEILQPVFDQIDAMARDGLLSTEEIGSIAALAQERIPMINDAMTNLMASLAAAGLDVRTSTAGFKGISKSIAGASEESILGLAAAVNTQNFYMSYVPIINENVAAILSAMTGGAVTGSGVNLETTENGEVMPSVQKMIYDHLPLMDQNLAELLRLVRSVITTKNGSTNTNYVAVK